MPNIKNNNNSYIKFQKIKLFGLLLGRHSGCHKQSIKLQQLDSFPLLSVIAVLAEATRPETRPSKNASERETRSRPLKVVLRPRPWVQREFTLGGPPTAPSPSLIALHWADVAPQHPLPASPSTYLMRGGRREVNIGGRHCAMFSSLLFFPFSSNAGSNNNNSKVKNCMLAIYREK